MSAIKFTIQKKLKNRLGRAGILETSHGEILTPSFVAVGTKGTVKSLSPEQVKDLGAQVVLANTYHLYLEPGEQVIKKAGGLHKFMNWNGPTMTDSGGFQVFSLGAAAGKGISKFIGHEKPENNLIDEAYGENTNSNHKPLAKVDDNGVTFKSVIDGSTHRFTPERSIEIQNNIGADMIFAFDEALSPHAGRNYFEKSVKRTNEWAKRCLDFHKKNGSAEKQGLLGIVQGGRFEDLRKENARYISSLDFDGFGIGGAYVKTDIENVIPVVNKILPEEKPRHLLGVGEPLDLFGAVENGCDLFDCVAPTRMARNGTLYTSSGRINITNAKFSKDFSSVEKDCGCYACKNYTRAYIAHLFRSKEMFAATLASIHNLYFINHLVQKIRQSILDENFEEFKGKFLKNYFR